MGPTFVGSGFATKELGLALMNSGLDATNLGARDSYSDMVAKDLGTVDT